MRAALSRLLRPRIDESVEDRLVWMFGSPRTGSTWLASLLRADERVVFVDEPGLGMHLGVFLPDVLGAPAESFPPGGILFHQVRSTRRDYFFARDYEGVWSPHLRRLVLARFGAHLERAGRARDGWCLIKEPNGSQAADLIMSMLPRARLLFLVRDGRDVVDSELDAAQRDTWLTRHGGGWDMTAEERLAFVRERAHRWLCRTESVQRAYERHDPARRLALRYEELLADTRAQLDRVLAWLGSDLAAWARDAIVAREAFDALPAERRGSGRFSRAATPGLWRENLTPAEQAVIEEVMGAKLRELGYEAGAPAARAC